MVIGKKRSGKTTLTNLICGGRVSKSANDFASVTQKPVIYNHSDENCKVSFIDTQGIETNTNYFKTIARWLEENALDENGNIIEGKKNKDCIHCFIYVIRNSNFPKPKDWFNGNFFLVR